MFNTSKRLAALENAVEHQKELIIKQQAIINELRDAMTVGIFSDSLFNAREFRDSFVRLTEYLNIVEVQEPSKSYFRKRTKNKTK